MFDSNTRPSPDEKWNDLLRQLQNQPKAQPQPLFYNRVRARLVADAPADSATLLGWLRRPAYAVLLGALVLTLSGDESGPDLTSAAAYSGDSQLPPR